MKPGSAVEMPGADDEFPCDNRTEKPKKGAPGMLSGLCELAGSSEPAFQLVIEAKVDIDFFIRRTIERPRGCLG